MDYLNFDLRIELPTSDGYPITAELQSDGSEVCGFLELDLTNSDLKWNLCRLDEGDTDLDFLIDFGKQLYEALFRGRVSNHFSKSCGKADPEKGLRIRLRIKDAEIGRVPWEFLYHPEKGCFLSTQTKFPIVRYLPVDEPIRSLETSFPIRILVAIPGGTGLDTEAEKRDLVAALSDVAHLEVNFIEGIVTLDHIDEALSKKEYHCFHFIGHGAFRDRRGCLVLNNKDGDIQLVDDEVFAETFDNHYSMKIVVLNSCRGAEISSRNALTGMAPLLVENNIPAVIAMRYEIYDDEAIKFTKSFYSALFQGSHQGFVDYAISIARHRLYRNYRGRRAMGTPVLYQRAADGLLFKMADKNLFTRMNPSLGRGRLLRAARNQLQKNTLLYSLPGNENHYSDKEKILHETEFKQVKMEIRAYNRMIIAVASVMTLMFFLSWVRLFDILGLDTRIEAFTIWFGDFFTEKTFDDRLMMVRISKETEKMLGRKLDKSWRKEHAQLVNVLTDAGARAIVFDFYFESESEFDHEFANAIRRAEDTGTSIVLGYRSLKDGKPNMPDGFIEATPNHGLACIGRKLWFARTIPLAVEKENGGTLVSLPLSTLLALSGDRLVNLKKENWDRREIFTSRSIRSLSRAVKFSESSVVRSHSATEGCPALDIGDTAADIFVDHTSADFIRKGSRTIPYEHFFFNMAFESRERFKNRIFVIGHIEDKVKTFREQRHGLELHADVINSLLISVAIHSVEWPYQLFIMILLGFLGGCIGWKYIEYPHKAWIILSAIVLGYFITTICLYINEKVLLNVLYHVGAILLGYHIANYMYDRKLSA